MIAIIDYDAGNTHSVKNALTYLGADVCLTSSPEEIYRADKVILPGVGHFGAAMEKLETRRLMPVIRTLVKEETPLLGICLGLQMLFSGSEEAPDTAGLCLLPGFVKRFTQKDGFKIPQIGWNTLSVRKGSRLLAGIESGSAVYFVHSYYAKADDPSVVAATTEYTDIADVAVEKGNLFATQFHPEKSGQTGLAILRNFLSV